MTALVILEAAVIVLLSILVAGLLRSHAEILRRLHELGAGEPTPAAQQFVRRSGRRGAATPVGAISGSTPSRGAASIALDGSRGLVLIAFLSTGCSSCRPFWESVDPRLTAPNGDLRLVVVTKSPTEESVSAVRELQPTRTTVVMSSEAWDAFEVPVVPYFVLVDASNGEVLGEGAGGSWSQVIALMGDAIGDATAGSEHGGRATTKVRMQDTDEELRRAGIEPEDPSLYLRPSDGTTP